MEKKNRTVNNNSLANAKIKCKNILCFIRNIQTKLYILIACMRCKVLQVLTVKSINLSNSYFGIFSQQNIAGTYLIVYLFLELYHSKLRLFRQVNIR